MNESSSEVFFMVLLASLLLNRRRSFSQYEEIMGIHFVHDPMLTPAMISYPLQVCALTNI